MTDTIKIYHQKLINHYIDGDCTYQGGIDYLGMNEQNVIDNVKIMRRGDQSNNN